MLMNPTMLKRQSEQGSTLFELLIFSSLTSVMLWTLTAGTLQIHRTQNELKARKAVLAYLSTLEDRLFSRLAHLPLSSSSPSTTWVHTDNNFEIAHKCKQSTDRGPSTLNHYHCKITAFIVKNGKTKRQLSTYHIDLLTQGL